jgi:SAM-dependent methyltransferase
MPIRNALVARRSIHYHHGMLHTTLLDIIWSRTISDHPAWATIHNQEPPAMEVWLQACEGGDVRRAIPLLAQHMQRYPAQTADGYALIARAYCNLGEPYRQGAYALKALWHDSHNLDGLHELASAIASLTFWQNPISTFLRYRHTVIERQLGVLPPARPHDKAGWDAFWRYRIAHRALGELLPAPVLSPALIERLYHRGLRRVLCVGNGISQEPRLLAYAGFTVVALDLAPVATTFAQAFALQLDDLRQLEPELVPHSGGNVAFYTGDLLQPTIAPGPFDLLIIRRTLQHFTKQALQRAVRHLLARLAPNGMLVNHAHNAYQSAQELHTVLHHHGMLVRADPQDGEDLPEPTAIQGGWAWSVHSSG